MLFLIVQVTIIILLLFVIGLIIYARWNYGVLDGLGFPVMMPQGILGSDSKLHQKIQHFEDIERCKKFGPIWGYYQGRTPIIFIADSDLIRTIFVKENSHFYNRQPLEFGDPFLNQILDFLPGEKWKTMRVTQTKLFSLAKIKQYSNEVFNECTDLLISKLQMDIKAGGTNYIKINARERFCTFTVDAIARSMFSMRIEPETDAKFYNACKKVIGEGQEINQFHVWTLTFPFLSKYSPTLVLDHAMTDKFLEIVKSRTKTGETFGDYGDVLVNCFKLLSTPCYKKLGITTETLLGQAANLILAGFDRITSHMTFLAYHIASNVSIQEKLYSEIMEHVGPNHNPNSGIGYATIQNMVYLNACTLEIARLYSVLIRPERVCNKDWVDPSRGIRIPKGVLVMIASWAVNRNPEYYDRPDEFIPERFLIENKSNLNPYAFTTFGFGHRNCIGMRFAYEALKLSIARLVLLYRFELRPETTLIFKKGINFILQFEPVFLNLVQRGIE